MTDNRVLSLYEISEAVKSLLLKYNAEYAILFGSYARGEANTGSDIDLIVFGGGSFKPTDIFSFGEELRELLQKNADVYEISEINIPSPLYQNILRYGVKIA